MWCLSAEGREKPRQRPSWTRVGKLGSVGHRDEVPASPGHCTDPGLYWGQWGHGTGKGSQPPSCQNPHARSEGKEGKEEEEREERQQGRGGWGVGGRGGGSLKSVNRERLKTAEKAPGNIPTHPTDINTITRGYPEQV